MMSKEEQPKPVIALVGQTASGKSALAMHLAQKYNGEIIAADSRTIYTDMDIGTAKPCEADRKLVVHHCLDLVAPDQTFSAGEFKRRACVAIDAIQRRGRLPILVGGSGLYIDSVLFDYQFSDPPSERDEVNPRHLKKINQPAEAKKLRPNTLVIGFQVNPGVLIARIEARVDAMLQDGLLQEVQNVRQKYGAESPGLLAPGYKALGEYLDGMCSLADAKNMFIAYDKKLAKRQKTWFQRNKDIRWIHTEQQADDLTRDFLSKFATINPRG